MPVPSNISFSIARNINFIITFSSLANRLLKTANEIYVSQFSANKDNLALCWQLSIVLRRIDELKNLTHSLQHFDLPIFKNKTAL